MEILKQKWKKNLIVKIWERCNKSLGSASGFSKSNKTSCEMMRKSKSLHCATKSSSSSSSSPSPSPERNNKKRCQQRVAPEGYFTVYVGPQKQRFVIKTEFASHPLFKMLLEDAESEFGYESQGPITLPCDVDLLYKVLAEMESGDQIGGPGRSSSFANCSPLLILCSPARRPNPKVYNNNGCAYMLLSPSRMLKMNGF